MHVIKTVYILTRNLISVSANGASMPTAGSTGPVNTKVILYFLNE